MKTARLSAEPEFVHRAPKRVVNQRGDHFEQEADRMADRVMSGKYVTSAKRSVFSDHGVSLRGGQALDLPMRALMESRFGYDFSRVRVHADEKAADSARAFNADAFTVGRDVVFGAGQYRPRTIDGQRLLAHELAHVVQQTSGLLPSPRLQRKAATGLTTKIVDHGVSSAAVEMAKRRMNEVLGSLADPAGGELKGATVELHLIPHDKKLTELKEFASLKGTKTFDGRSYDELRGVGATKIGDKITYAVAEEQLVSIKGQPSAYALGFVAAHESGHVVEQFGLTKAQKKDLKDAYDARKTAKGPWLAPDWYTSSGTGEYFAQCTSAYFNRPYSDSETDKKTYTRVWLKKNDPAITKLLATVYA